MIFLRFFSHLSGAEILKKLEATSGEKGKKVAEAYGITASDDEASRQGAMQFMGDARFNLPSIDMTQNLRDAGKKVHRFIFDEANPFYKKQPLSYHAVDLLAVFGGYDDVVGDEMRKVGQAMRSNWISFANGDQPWDASKVFGYGPNGKTGELNDEEAASRRRVKQFEVLREVGFETYQELMFALR